MTGILGGLIASFKKLIAWTELVNIPTTDFTIEYEAAHYSADKYIVCTNNGIFDFDASTNVATLRSSTYQEIVGSAKGSSGVLGLIDGTAGLVKTTNGTSFSTVVSLGNSGADVATNSNGTWIAVYSNTDYKYSTDNLVSTTTRGSTFGATTPNEATYLASANLFAALIRGSATYYTSATGTGAWTTRTLPFTLYGGTSSNRYKATTSSTTYTYCYDASRNIWRTSDLINWTNLGNPNDGNTEDMRHIIANENNIVVQTKRYTSAVDTTAFRTYYSLDAGQTWTSLSLLNRSGTVGSTYGGYAMANNQNLIFSFYNASSGPTDATVVRSLQL